MEGEVTSPQRASVCPKGPSVLWIIMSLIANHHGEAVYGVEVMHYVLPEKCHLLQLLPNNHLLMLLVWFSAALNASRHTRGMVGVKASCQNSDTLLSAWCGESRFPILPHGEMRKRSMFLGHPGLKQWAQLHLPIKKIAIIVIVVPHVTIRWGQCSAIRHDYCLRTTSGPSVRPGWTVVCTWAFRLILL